MSISDIHRPEPRVRTSDILGSDRNRCKKDARQERADGFYDEVWRKENSAEKFFGKVGTGGYHMKPLSSRMRGWREAVEGRREVDKRACSSQILRFSGCQSRPK